MTDGLVPKEYRLPNRRPHLWEFNSVTTTFRKSADRQNELVKVVSSKGVENYTWWG